jgi:hypothetical protein
MRESIYRERGCMWLISGLALAFVLVVGIRLLWRHRWLRSRALQRGESRRGCRVALSAPVFVYGWLPDGPFSKNTETVNASAAGGLIALSAEVTPSQELVVTNLRTDEDQHCRVVRLMTAEDGRTLAGFEFLQDSPHFWQIDFVSGSSSSPVDVAQLTYN